MATESDFKTNVPEISGESFVCLVGSPVKGKVVLGASSRGEHRYDEELDQKSVLLQLWGKSEMCEENQSRKNDLSINPFQSVI